MSRRALHSGCKEVPEALRVIVVVCTPWGARGIFKTLNMPSSWSKHGRIYRNTRTIPCWQNKPNNPVVGRGLLHFYWVRQVSCIQMFRKIYKCAYFTREYISLSWRLWSKKTHGQRKRKTSPKKNTKRRKKTVHLPPHLNFVLMKMRETGKKRQTACPMKRKQAGKTRLAVRLPNRETSDGGCGSFRYGAQWSDTEDV